MSVNFSSSWKVSVYIMLSSTYSVDYELLLNYTPIKKSIKRMDDLCTNTCCISYTSGTHLDFFALAIHV